MKEDREDQFFEEPEEEAGGFPNLDKYLNGRERHWVSYTEGAKMYRIPYYVECHFPIL